MPADARSNTRSGRPGKWSERADRFARSPGWNIGTDPFARPAVEALGYVHRPDNMLVSSDSHLFLRKVVNGKRTRLLHVLRSGPPEIADHRLFRDELGPIGSSYWVGLLQRGFREELLIAEHLGSDEYDAASTAGRY